jgi:hypothetical protein
MATIWDRRRRIRDGAARSNERNCRISKIPSALSEQSFRETRKAQNEKMLSLEGRVEDTTKIATPPSSDP